MASSSLDGSVAFRVLVVREVPQGFSSPQMLQVAVGRQGQLEQSGPSGVRVFTTFLLP
jgi:hypothetical protein